MFTKTGLVLAILIFLFSAKLYTQGSDKVVDDFTFKFTFKMPAGWEMKDMK